MKSLHVFTKLIYNYIEQTNKKSCKTMLAYTDDLDVDNKKGELTMIKINQVCEDYEIIFTSSE